MVRRKDSEIAVLKEDQKRLAADKKTLESEKTSLSARHDSMQTKLRQVQAEADAMRSQIKQLERESQDTRMLLEARLSEDLQAGNNRRILDEQIKDLKGQLFQVQSDLSRERQSRDDIRMLSEHELASMKDGFENLNESKITIEKELYVQQDTLRRANEARALAENGRKELQAELKKLRDRFH